MNSTMTKPSTVPMTWFRWIPGVAHILQGKKIFGITTMFFFFSSPCIIALKLGDFIDSILSFLLTIILFVTQQGDQVRLYRADIVDWWFASAVLIATPVLIFIYSRESIVRLQRRTYDTSVSQWMIAWQAFKKQKLGVITVYIILALYFIACIAPFAAPFNPNAQQDIPVTQYQPPLTSITVLQLRRDRIPPLEATVRDGDGFFSDLSNELITINHRLTDTGISRILFVDSFQVQGDSVIGWQKGRAVRLAKDDLQGADERDWVASRFYVLGSDRFGRGILSRLIYGSRASLILGLMAVLLAIFVGTGVGLFSGYFGGRLDSFLMRSVDILLAFPTLFFILIIVSLFETIPIPRIILIVIVLGLTSWMSVSRFVRGQVLAVKEEEYILAAKALGLHAHQIILRHILPNILTPIIINATLRLGGIILLEAALSFLNLGVQTPTPSWGNIIAEGKDFLSSAWWISTFPGFAIVFTVICFNIFGDSLRDALDPKLKD